MRSMDRSRRPALGSLPMRPLALALAAAALVVATSAVAQKKDAPKDAPKETAAQSGKGVRKDPQGKTGISPYMEAVAKGEVAFVARDFPGAITAFQDAIKTDGEKMLAFYRLGEAQLASNKPDEADAAWQTALSKKGADALKAKVLFVIADLRERQGKWQEAKDAWTAYASFVQGSSSANGYAASATERQKTIDRRVKDEKDYGAVKERIKAREAERQKEAEENAKKDKLNR